MANVSEKVKKIRMAVYGKDVRDSIASSIEEMNEECTEAVNGYESAIQAASSAAETAMEKSKLAERSADKADSQAQAAQEAAENADQVLKELQNLEVSQLKSQIAELTGTVNRLNSSIAELEREKVDKEEGKGLSSNNYSDDEKQMLHFIQLSEMTDQFQVTGSESSKITLRQVHCIGRLIILDGEINNIQDGWLTSSSQVSITCKNDTERYLPMTNAPVHFGGNNTGFTTGNLILTPYGNFYGYLSGVSEANIKFQIIYISNGGN